jgi:hypothetical protein
MNSTNSRSFSNYSNYNEEERKQIDKYLYEAFMNALKYFVDD